MIGLSEDVTHFFQKQGFVIVSTIDRHGTPHSACKGIVKLDKNRGIYLLDLYTAETFKNLKANPRMSITAIDEHKFTGYCLKGMAKIIKGDKINPQIIKAWEERVASRITQRILKNIQGEKGHALHPESRLPKPAYMIKLEVHEIIDLTPRHLK